jgi:hypothetical protein
MSKPRTIQEINNEYFQTAAMLGDLEWKMTKFPDQIDQLKAKLITIDKEADMVQKSQERDQQAKIQKAKADKDTKSNGTLKTTEETPVEEASVQ